MGELFKEKFGVFLAGAALAITGAGIKIYTDVSHIEELKSSIHRLDDRSRDCAERLSRLEGRLGREHGGSM